MPDNHYENPKLAAIYDSDSGWSVDRDFYLALAGEPPQKILDLGCGTGLLCDAYAALGHDVTGVDPAAAMLEVARSKPHGDKIQWIQSFAQTFNSDGSFDLIIMTGHAFQVLVEDAHIHDVFSVIRKHLKSDGRFVFESRNPFIDWASQWNYSMNLQLPGQTVRESRKFLSLKNGRMQFELKYEFPDETLLSTSELRFSNASEIENQLNSAGLKVHSLLGDWDGAAFNESISEEMIFVVKLE
ncbi:MAG TPA: methyltransferase domain-containing protein [Candidatus Melainabacteria bacterium]|nr:methyltransferase domain-containing protein [Candidatus Melainabacteria bacterium]